jgi:hypothetical protein
MIWDVIEKSNKIFDFLGSNCSLITESQTWQHLLDACRCVFLCTPWILYTDSLGANTEWSVECPLSQLHREQLPESTKCVCAGRVGGGRGWILIWIHVLGPFWVEAQAE